MNLDDEKTPFDPRLEETFKLIQGTQAMPWLFITSKKYKPSSVSTDSIAVPIVQTIADMAKRYGLKVALYHHVWFWLETVEHGISLTKKINRPNVGITFNLAHYLATQYYAGQNPVANFPAWAAKAKPYLFAVSVNGADFPPPSPDRSMIWNTLIQPLGEGQYDTYGFLKTFWDMGFQGPVGLQCYNIKQPKTVHLNQSIKTWQAYKKRYAAARQSEKNNKSIQTMLSAEQLQEYNEQGYVAVRSAFHEGGSRVASPDIRQRYGYFREIV